MGYYDPPEPFEVSVSFTCVNCSEQHDDVETDSFDRAQAEIDCPSCGQTQTAMVNQPAEPCVCFAYGLPDCKC